MTLYPWLVLAVLAAASSPETPANTSSDSAAETPVTTNAALPAIDPERAKVLADYRLFKLRGLEAQGIAPAAGGIIVPPTVGPQPTFAEKEAALAAVYDGYFGKGAWRDINRYLHRCQETEGCNFLPAAGVITGAESFVALKKDKGVVEGSPAYKQRHQEIRTKLHSAVDEVRPQKDSPAQLVKAFINSATPIVRKIYTPEEFLKFAQKNAVVTDAAPAYAHLGQVLNGQGPPGRAREAFNAALQRDPANQEALSGRAQANYNMGDYAGAASDAGAALKLNPGDKNAFATLKLSEGRAAASGSGGGSAAAQGAASASGGAAPGGAAVSQLGGAPGGPGQGGAGEQAGAGLAAGGGENVRKAELLTTEARRSFSMGDARSAADSLRRAIELNPQNAQAMSLASMAYNRLKNYPAAIEMADAGLRLAPNSAALLNSKALAQNHMKEYSGALASADRALALNPRDAMAYFNRAVALGGLHDRPGMLAALRSAAEADAKFVPILESAIQMPEDSDILYLFPGENPAAAAQAAPMDAPAETGRPAWLMLGGGVFLGILAALLLSAMMRRSPPTLRG